MICVYSCIHTICLALALAPSCTIRPWTGLGRILGSRFRNCEKHWCLQGTNGNVATRWSIKLSILNLLLLWLNIYLSKRFNSSIKFVHLKIALGLALHESWGVACATRQKHWCPVSTFAYVRGKAFLNKPAKITTKKPRMRLSRGSRLDGRLHQRRQIHQKQNWSMEFCCKPLLHGSPRASSWHQGIEASLL